MYAGADGNFVVDASYPRLSDKVLQAITHRRRDPTPIDTA